MPWSAVAEHSEGMSASPLRENRSKPSSSWLWVQSTSDVRLLTGLGQDSNLGLGNLGSRVFVRIPTSTKIHKTQY